MIRLLQIVRDEKFANSATTVASNKYIQSETIFYIRNKKKWSGTDDSTFTIIKSKSKLLSIIESGDYDAIFFHSLPVGFYNIVNHVPKDKFVIWFSYGFDIYGDIHEHGLFGLPAFVEKDLYKSQTRKLINKGKSIKQIFNDFCGKLCYYPHWRLRDDVISRIDYFQPVRPMDFRIMQHVDGFRAQEIFLSNYNINIDGKAYIKHAPDGAILLGNSASPVINHIDVLQDIKDAVSEGRQIIVPLSYGRKQYAEAVKKILVKYPYTFTFLDSFIPREDYFQLMNSCSFAVFGSMRQHAMGNIYNALRNDIKVFLYRDSPMYDYLREMGYVIYAIEDVDGDSFKLAITEAEHNQNVSAFAKEHDYCYNKGQQMLEEIAHQVEIRKEKSEYINYK